MSTFLFGHMFSISWGESLGVELLSQKVTLDLVVEWLRICFAMQGMWTPSLVGELGSHILGSNYSAPQLERLHASARVHEPHQRSHTLQLRPNGAKQIK